MAQSDFASIPGEPPGDLKRTMLPKSVVAVVIGLAFLPIILNGLGISFSAASSGPVALEAVEGQLQPAPVPPEINRGAMIYLLLEWTAFMIALATVVLAVTHYFITHDVTTPIISTALFFSGTIDAFEAMAGVHLLPITVDDMNRFLPFTWFVSRLVNVCFLIAGTLPFVWRPARPVAQGQERDLPFLIFTGVLFAGMSYLIVFLCAWSNVPQVLYPSWRVVHRPCDLIPLFLYLFAGAVVLPRFYRAQPSLFSHALFVSVIPNIAAELHAAFGSVANYDNNFNIACFEKIVAYLVPFVGLLLDYRRAYDADVALQVTHEKLRVARNVQQGLLPQTSPEITGYEISGHYLPADMVGGDYYDYVRMADGRWGIVVADVSGHEIGASLLMAKTRAYLRALAKSHESLETILGRLHEFLLEDTQDKWFVTMFFAALDAPTGALEYAGAAQQAFILRAGGTVTILKSTSTPLGVFADHPPRCGPGAVLEAGDVFVAPTDGFVEAKSPAGEQFGQDRLIAVLRDCRHRTSAEMLDALNHCFRSFCGTAPVADDLTVVILRRTP
jgi:sigma-B regulation protein RsbU (phosphoserine phosphatase)